MTDMLLERAARRHSMKTCPVCHGKPIRQAAPQKRGLTTEDKLWIGLAVVLLVTLAAGLVVRGV